MATRMQQRRGTAAEWTLVNPVLAVGEIGFETDTNSFKIGDGTNAWADLSYFQTLDGLSTSLDDYIPITDKGVANGVATLDATGNVPMSQLGNIIDGAPEVLDTLNELAAAINDDPNFLTDKVSKAGDTMTGDLTLAGAPTTDLHAATKGYVDSREVSVRSDLEAYADQVETDANAYADQAEVDAKAYTDTREAAITIAYQTYADQAEIDAKAYADQKVADIVNTAPEALDTLNELAAALGDDPNFATTVSTQIGEKVSKAGDTMTGDLTLAGDPTANLHAATKAYVDTGFSGLYTSITGETELAIANAITVESTNRDAAIDTAIDAAIEQEVADRDAAILASVSSAIIDEAAARDLAISSAINTEVTARDNAISTAVSDEAAARDLAISSAVSTASTSQEEYTDGAITAHNGTTLNVHGIADTGALATKTYADDAVSTHNLITTNVHGIADTSVLATTTDVATAKQEAIDAAAVASELYADGLAANYEPVGTAATAVSTHEADTLNVHGIADTSKLVVTDGANTQTISGDLTVTGNFTVSGTTTTVDVTDLVISDPLIYIGEGNSANLVDLGLVSSFNDGTYQHSGIARDSSAGKWKVFKGVTDEPTTTINFDQGSLDDLAVNNVEVAGVVFSDGTQTKQGVPSITTISQKIADYTLSSLTERDTIIEISDASSHTLTIPSDSTLNFPVGTTLDVIQTGGGQVTIAGAQGVTVNATPGLKLRTQWSSATLLKRAANTWLVYGDLSA